MSASGHTSHLKKAISVWFYAAHPILGTALMVHYFHNMLTGICSKTIPRHPGSTISISVPHGIWELLLFVWLNSALSSNGWNLSSLSQCKVISELHTNKKKAPKHISVALNGQKTELWSYSTSTSFPFTSIFSKQITPQNWLLSVLLTAKNFLMLMIKYLRELLHQALSWAIFYTNALFRCNIMHCFTQESNIYF